ncbi:type II secretion system protein GspL [Lelliottia sp. WAP21]|uniref:type II secretion system protein GspL n=1 Tax=Lelliottia sp. WAP21 TaxID=2877426 RepID=UPI001E3768CD|nr:type II secretion system protein GspL [Lelliottia sp. WAP21]
MKQVLFIRPDSREDGKIGWCVSGSQQVETLDGVASLSALAGHALAESVCLLLPASDMIFRHFTLPKKGLSAQATPFSWMAEETLIGEVDNLHWTVLAKKGREVDAVAIDASRLRQWLSLFAEAGLKVVQVLPDAWLLPVSHGGSTVVALDDHYWLRFSPNGACVVDATLLAMLMPKSGEGAVCCYGDVPPGIDVDEQRAWQHPMLLIQPQWQTCRVNLLHGEFSLKTRTGKAGKGTQATLFAMALLSLGLLIGPRVAMAWMLVQQETHLQQEIIQLYQHHFPSLRHQTNIKYHFGQNMKKQTKGIFLQLEELEQIKAGIPTLEVTSLEYDKADGGITLNVSADNQPALQEFMTRTREHFNFSLQPVSTEAPYTAMINGTYK